MPKRTLSDLLFWPLAALAGVFFLGLLLALAGVVPVGDDPPAPAPSEPPAAATSPRTTGEATTEATASTREAATTAAEADRPTTVVIRASRGASWFSARAGSEEGRVLDERTLAQGESAQVEAERVWLTVGAAGNVDVLVNGRPLTVPVGTIALLLGGQGVSSG
jgi:hypothetical protein